MPKTYNGEKTDSSTNVAKKTGYLPTENWNIHVYNSEQVSTQSQLKTLVWDLKPWS
jgi:hypothetical protein